MKFTRGRRKFTKSKKTPVRKSRRVSIKTVKKVVKRQIAINTENKIAESFDLSHNFYYPAQGSLYDSENLILLGIQPGSISINQSSAQNGRNGNRVKIKSCILKGVFFPQPYNASVNPLPKPLEVRLVLFYDRSNPAAITYPRSDFFQYNASSQPITGDMTDIIAPINKDKYRVLGEKKFKLGFSEYAGTGTDAAAQRYANNDFKYNYKLHWNITKYMVSNVIFNDNNTDPTTRKLFMQVIICAANGDTISSGVIPARAFFMQHLEYEDA